MHNRTSQRIQCFCLLFPGPPFPLFHDITKNLIFQRVQCMFSLSKNSVYYIEIINNKARHNLINVKYRQMAFQSARWRCSWEFFGNPLVKRKWCTAAGGRQPTNEICCRTKKLSNRKNKVFDVKFLVKTFGMNKKDHKMAVNAGQTLNHGLLAARHSIAGQGFSNGCLQGYNRSQ